MLCVCLVFGLLFVSSPTSYADEVFEIDGLSYIQSDLEEGFYLENDTFHVYLDGEEQIGIPASTYGTVSDQSNLINIGYDVYSTAFNWRTEEQFVPTADIGYVKSFADSVISSALQNTQVNSLDSAEQVLKGIIGETIVLYYQDENGNSTLPENSKITLDLSFDDTTLAGQSSWRSLCWSLNSPYSFSEVYSNATITRYLANSTPLLNFFDAWGSNKYFLLGNTVNVYFVDSSGERSVLGTYTDASSINTTFTAPSDVVAVYIDVQYDMSGGVLEQRNPGVIKSGYNLSIPSIYKLSLSGNISVDTSGVNTGLLKSIIAWLKSILSAIQALPTQIANLVVDGVKNLFVPSSENIMATFDTLKATAEGKLGFLYSIFQMVYDLFNSIASGLTDPMETLTIPRLSLPFKYVDGGELVIWEEMTFDIMPKGLEVLRDLVKLLTSLVLITATMSHCIEYFRAFFKQE